MARFGLSRSDRLVARLRMPFAALALFVLVVLVLGGVRGTWALAALAAAVVGLGFYVRLGTPQGAPIDVGPPVSGRWLGLNSPTSRVPSHHVHAWGQTYAIDLVADPADDSRPGMSWWPLARRPDDYPGFGRPILAPVDGTVARAVGGMRDHWSRTSVPGLLWFVLETVRELGGPRGVLGNHVVIERDDGACVLLAHLARRSIRVRRGERVYRGDVVARCGNSGNSTEPHVHLQVMDHPSAWIGAALPMRFDGRPLPADGEHLLVPGPPDLIGGWPAPRDR